jgi:hypothetical protein
VERSIEEEKGYLSAHVSVVEGREDHPAVFVARDESRESDTNVGAYNV